EDQGVLVGTKRALAQPEDIALAVINRNGVQPHRRQGCAQLPTQSFRRGRLRVGGLAAGGRAWWERVVWLQDLPHRGLRFQYRFAFRVTAYSRRRREVGLVHALANGKGVRVGRASPRRFAESGEPAYILQRFSPQAL